MSGKFAQYVSCAHPDRVLGQILVAGCPAGALAMPPELLADWYAREGDAGRMAAIVTQYATQPVSAELLERCGQDAARVPRAALQGTMELVTSTSFKDRLNDLAGPPLVVGGRDDQIFTPEVLAEAVAAPLPGARLEILDCGHEIPIEQPRQLARLIDEFATEVLHRATEQQSAGSA